MLFFIYLLNNSVFGCPTQEQINHFCSRLLKIHNFGFFEEILDAKDKQNVRRDIIKLENIPREMKEECSADFLEDLRDISEFYSNYKHGNMFKRNIITFLGDLSQKIKTCSGNKKLVLWILDSEFNTTEILRTRNYEMEQFEIIETSQESLGTESIDSWIDIYTDKTEDIIGASCSNITNDLESNDDTDSISIIESKGLKKTASIDTLSKEMIAVNFDSEESKNQECFPKSTENLESISDIPCRKAKDLEKQHSSLNETSPNKNNDVIKDKEKLHCEKSDTPNPISNQIEFSSNKNPPKDQKYKNVTARKSKRNKKK